MAKPKITRTYGPIHFEDLDPHRFEDLVRELIYDFKEWQTIEATGRSGNDGGFDVRAFEKVSGISDSDDEDEEKTEVYPMEGKLWMIQGKREKEIGPKKLEKILGDIDSENPPYGYILAASANFSKDSYDLFRSELRKKGVMEFYLWGRAELEDMLHLPKNDRILFTFFGISLVSQKKSRSTEIRQIVVNKNKLYRFLGENLNSRRSVLLRDINDKKYPYKSGYKDFKDRPRWREFQAVEHHPLGLIVKTRENFAYIDPGKKEFDYVEDVNLMYRESDTNEDRQKLQKTREKIEDFWENMPRYNQAKFFRNGLVSYSDMLVIDDKGDTLYKFPHIHADYRHYGHPFSGSFEFLEVADQSVSLEGYKRVKKFPSSFPLPRIGKIHDDKGITLSDQGYRMLQNNPRFFTLYDFDGHYLFLKQRDFVPIENKDAQNIIKYYLQITNVESLKVKDYLKGREDLAWDIEQQIGRKPEPEDIINIYEFKKSFDSIVARLRESKKNKNNRK